MRKKQVKRSKRKQVIRLTNTQDNLHSDKVYNVSSTRGPSARMR